MMARMPEHRFEIEPRPINLGGGWRLRLLEDDTEVGGGVYPPEPDLGITSDDAHADALEAGETWLASVAP